MTASTISHSYFDNPTYPRRMPAGATIVPFSKVIPTTSIDETDDRIRMVPLPNGVEIVLIVFFSGDLDSNEAPALDMDWVINDDDGDTIVGNMGTAFQGATTANTPVVVVVPPGTKAVVSQAANGPGQSGVASLDLKVNTAAGTAAQGTVAGFVVYQNAP